MIIYGKKESNVAPCVYQKVLKERRCDLTGKLLFPDADALNGKSYATYNFEYGSEDPLWGQGDEIILEKSYDINLKEFLLAPYEIRWDIEIGFMKRMFLETESPSFDGFLRSCRTEVALEMLNDGKIEPWQLVGGPIEGGPNFK